MSRQFATNVTTIYDIFCPVPFLPSPFGFRRILDATMICWAPEKYSGSRMVYHLSMCNNNAPPLPASVLQPPRAETAPGTCTFSKVPEGHHARGTTLREALRGNLPLRGLCGVSPRVLRGSLRGFQKGRKGAGVKGAGVANCRIFRSAVPSVVVWSILLVSLSGEEKVMTIYDAGPLAAGPLWGSLRGFCGVLRGSAGVREIFRGFSGGSDPMLVTLRNCWNIAASTTGLQQPLRRSYAA